MQNEQTLLDIGFKRIAATDEYLYRGIHQKFTAFVGYDKTFIQLYLVSPFVDERPNSDTKGKHFRSRIKDCCSHGSIARAVLEYDLQESMIKRQVGGIRII